MRTLSTDFKTDANEQQISTVFFTLLTIGYVTGTGSASCSVDDSTKVITTTTANWVTLGIVAGDTITFTGFINAANNDTFVVTLVTATELTLGNSTTLVTEGSATIGYSFKTILRIVNNHASVTSNSNVFSAFAFQFIMPQEGEGRRSAKLVIDNVDRSLSAFVLDAGLVDMTVTEQLIRSSDPDTIEIERSYILRDVTITRKVISGELIYQQYLYDAFPKLVKTPALFPGVF